LSLGIAREHFNDEIVEAVVQLLLKRPGKLSVFDFARTEQKDVDGHSRLGSDLTDFNFDALGSRE
jgi:hypothetical protein